jgi:hypothetical protein
MLTFLKSTKKDASKAKFRGKKEGRSERKQRGKV